MTSVVLGLVGAGIGMMTGMPMGMQIGFLLGSLIGNLIDPPKVEGPRLHDTKLQTSEYGRPIPFVWGLGRISGNVIDQTDLEEHTQTEGGKMGPEVTTYTYSASFDILLCAKTPSVTEAIAGIKRIWADGRLIWSMDIGEPIPCTIYFGGLDQGVDPTFEAVHGVGNVPAYNGFAHVVFTDYFLTDFGNRIPQLEFEVYTKVGIFPWRFSTFNVDPTGFQLRNDAATLDGDTITISWGFRPSYPPTVRYFAQYKLDGTLVTPHYEVPASTYGTVTWHNLNLHDNGTFLDILGAPIAGMSYTDVVGLYEEDDLFVYLISSGGDFIVSGGPGVMSSSFYTLRTGGFASLIQFGTTNATTLEIAGGYHAGGSSVFKVYIVDRNDVPSGNLWLHELNVQVYDIVGGPQVNVSLSRTWDMYNQHLIQAIFNGASFVVYENNNGRLILAVDRGQAGSKQIYAFYLNPDLTTTGIHGVNYGSIFGQTHPISLLGHGPYMLVGDGVICLEPPAEPVPLYDIVGDLSKDFNDGTDVVAHSVSELTDLVRWYAVANVMTRRNAIQILRQPFFFDGVESDDLAVFRKRGGSSLATIPDGDLCGRTDGDSHEDPLRTIRAKEQGLPRTVTLTYYDVDSDYQTGAQSSPRQTTRSESDVLLDVPVGFTASEALQKSWHIQMSEWIEREQFEFQLTRKWAKLEPCDVVIVRGREVRIIGKHELPNGVLQFRAVLSAPSIYSQTATSVPGGFSSQPVPGGTVVTSQLVMMDIPVLSQLDSPFGFYIAMGPSKDGRWVGGSLLKSIDGGNNYQAVASVISPSIIGTTISSAGSPTVSGTLGAYFGGETVDESEIVVTLTDDDATLSSISLTALENGGNLAAVSRGLLAGSPDPGTLLWELLSFRDATLIAPKTYLLKGFKRSRKGTSSIGHADGDTFVLLSTAVNVDAPENELNVRLMYKGVSAGLTVAGSEFQYFTNTGLGTNWFYDTENNYLPPFTGASSGSPSVGGTKGSVPAPAAGDCEAHKFLSACGGWANVSALKVLTPGFSPSGSPLAALVTIDLGNYQQYSHVRVDVGTLTADIVLNIINGTNGQIIRVRLAQDASGGHLLTTGTGIVYSTSIPSVTLSLGANAIDFLGFEWDGNQSKARLMAVVYGF